MSEFQTVGASRKNESCVKIPPLETHDPIRREADVSGRRKRKFDVLVDTAQTRLTRRSHTWRRPVIRDRTVIRGK